MLNFENIEPETVKSITNARALTHTSYRTYRGPGAVSQKSRVGEHFCVSKWEFKPGAVNEGNLNQYYGIGEIFHIIEKNFRNSRTLYGME